MLDWKEFSKQEKKDWFNQIEKELKSSFRDIDNDYAYAHFSDIKNDENPVIIDRSNQSWLIRETFIADDPAKANTKILEALKGGVQELHLVSSAKFRTSELERLFRDVYIRMIHIHWTGPFQHHVFEFLKKNNSESLLLEWTDQAENSLIAKDQQQTIILSPPSSFDQILGVISMFKTAIEHIEKILESNPKGKDFGQFAFCLNSRMNFLNEIALLRAIRLVWANIVAAYGGDSQKYQARLLITIGDQTDFSDPNANLIRFTIQTMSSVLGGADSIEILPSNGDMEDTFRKRISRNIHHLLKLESFMDKVVDPGAGSYAIQLATQKYCKKIWKAIN